MRSILAYLDPGSSSVILQLIAGGFAAVAVSAKLFWHRILTFLHIRRDDPDPPPP
jgi:hypothetical protein